MHRIPAIKGSLQVQYLTTYHSRNSSLPNYESTHTSPRQDFSHPSPRKHTTKPSALNLSYKNKQPPPLTKSPLNETGTIMFRTFTPTYSGSEMFSPQSVSNYTRQISASRRDVMTPQTATPFQPHAKQNQPPSYKGENEIMVNEKGFIIKERKPILSNLVAGVQTDTTLTEQSVRASTAKGLNEELMLGDKNEYNLTIENEEKPNMGLKSRFQKNYEHKVLLNDNFKPSEVDSPATKISEKEFPLEEKKRIKMKGSLSLTTAGVFWKNNDTNAHLNKANNPSSSTKRKVLQIKKTAALDLNENRPTSICSARSPMELGGVGLNLASTNSVHLKSSSINASPKNDTLLLKSMSFRDTIIQNGNFWGVTEESALKQMQQQPIRISFSPRVSALKLGTPRNKGSIQIEKEGTPSSKVGNTPSRKGWKKGKSPWRRSQNITWSKVGLASSIYPPNVNEIDEDKVYQVDHQSIYKSKKGV